MRALVSATYGAYYNILPLPDLKPELRGRLRGKLRLGLSQRKDWGARLKERHPLIVGDEVDYDAEAGATGEVLIKGISPRQNAVYRSAGDQLQGLGANLDRVVILVGLSNPGPRFHFLDRVLASCYAASVPARIVFSKADLVPGADSADAKFASLYAQLGYRSMLINLISDPLHSDLEALFQEISQGTTLLIGNSGTGKSTLLNRVLGSAVQKTGEVSRGTGLGRHTTTNSRMIVHASAKAILIDTPGVADFGVIHVSTKEIIESFPEFRAAVADCEFADCPHEEKSQGCAVWALIEADEETSKVHPERRHSLLAMLDSLQYTENIRYGDYIKATGRIRTGKIRQKAKDD